MRLNKYIKLIVCAFILMNLFVIMIPIGVAEPVLTKPTSPILDKLTGPWSKDCDGTFYAIAAHPNDKSTIYIGSSHQTKGCGVYESVDGGNTWSPKSEGLPQFIFSERYPAISKIEISHSDPNVIYVGTYVDGGFSGLQGDIFKSADGGNSWKKMGESKIKNPVLDIAIDSNNPNIVFVGLGFQGVMKSTNGGTDWVQIIDGSNMMHTSTQHNIVKIRSGDNIFTSGFTKYTDAYLINGWQYSGALPLGLFQSNDGGYNWNIVKTETALITDLAIDPLNNDILYFSTAAAGVSLPVGHTQNKGIFKSQDKGNTWNPINNALDTDLSNFPINDIALDPSSPNILYAAADENIVFQSLDGGKNWNQIIYNPSFVIYKLDVSSDGHLLYISTSKGIYVGGMNSPPNSPFPLYQYAFFKEEPPYGKLIEIPIGETSNSNILRIEGISNDPDNDDVILEVEVQPVGTAFTDNPNCISGSEVSSGEIAFTTCKVLNNNQYHWQARTKDSGGAYSNWISMEDNSENDADFVVDTSNSEASSPPVASISFNPTNPDPKEEIIFNGANSHDPDGGYIVNYNWEFIRLTSYVPFPIVGVSEGPDKDYLNFKFYSEDYYEATLTVTDDEGDTSSVSKSIVVSPDAINIISPTQSSPVSAGAYNNPSNIEITVEATNKDTPLTGLTSNDFTIIVGEKISTLSLIDPTIPGSYKFKVSTPQQESSGSYDLKIKLKRAITISDTEKEAVTYSDEVHDGEKLDLIFVIDTTGSMGDDIAAVKSSASEIVEALDLKTSDYRVAVVDYRDYPQSPYGQPGLDYVYNLDLPFSNDKNTIINSINSLNLGSGMDWRESVYSALVKAMIDPNKDLSKADNYGWRNGVSKAFILMGDAPPHDPEPWSGGHTLEDVAYWSENIDPVIVYSVAIGSDPTTYGAFSEISERTGGKVYTSPTASDIVDTIIEVIGDIGDSPDLGVSVNINPAVNEANLGQSVTYSIDVTNTGTIADTFDISIDPQNFAGTYRGNPTAIQESWINLDQTSVEIEPDATETVSLTISVPNNWAGMENVIYPFEVTAKSETDELITNTSVTDLKVIANKRSKVEYSRLETIWLSELIQSSSINDEIKNSLLKKLTNAMTKLDQSILNMDDGKYMQANNMLEASQNIINAFINQVEAQYDKKIMQPDAEMLMEESNTTLQDVESAQNM